MSTTSTSTAAATSGSGGNGGNDGPGGGGGVGGNLDPGPTIIVSGLASSYHLFCDGERLYWVDVDTGDVRWASITGDHSGVLAPAAASTSADIEINDGGLFVAHNDRIMYVSFDGNQPSEVMAAPGVRRIYFSGDDLFWSDSERIYRWTDAVHEPELTFDDIAADEDGVYYTMNRSIWMAPLDGGAARRLARDTSASGGTLRATPEFVLWGTSIGLMRVAKDLGFPETLADSMVQRLALEPGVYAWMNLNEAYTMREGEPARRVAPANGAGGVAICAGYAFWLSRGDGTIIRAVP